MRRHSNPWVYTRILTGDGNFKADHVRRVNPGPDIWLSEGGGMMPKRFDYEAFLISARARKRVWLPTSLSALSLLMITIHVESAEIEIENPM